MIELKDYFIEDCKKAGLNESEIESLFEVIENVDYLEIQKLKRNLNMKYNENEVKSIFFDVLDGITDNQTLKIIIKEVDWIKKNKLENFINNNEFSVKTVCKNFIYSAEQIIEVVKNSDYDSVVAGSRLAFKINNDLDFVENMILEEIPDEITDYMNIISKETAKYLYENELESVLFIDDEFHESYVSDIKQFDEYSLFAVDKKRG